MALKINRRPMTVQDFIKLKKIPPYDNWRGAAKGENFGLMFGASAITFAGLLQRGTFSVEDCDEYIKLTHSEALYEEVCRNLKEGKLHMFTFDKRPEVECKFLTVAMLMRENFLKGYPGLAARIEREHEFAIKHFYTRMWYGSVRWHPELAYMTIDPFTKKLRKDSTDKKYNSLLFTHLMNNAANAAVQSGETVFIYAGWINADERMKLWNLQSKIYNTIHDSLDAYLWKPEKELMKSLINTCVHDKPRYPFENVYHFMEPEISDIRDYKYLTGYEEGEFDGSQKITGHFYKHGVEEKCKPIQEVIDAYNKQMHRDIKWKDMDF